MDGNNAGLSMGGQRQVPAKLGQKVERTDIYNRHTSELIILTYVYYMSALSTFCPSGVYRFLVEIIYLGFVFSFSMFSLSNISLLM